MERTDDRGKRTGIGSETEDTRDSRREHGIRRVGYDN